MGSIGVFPSNYVTKLAPREKPLQCRAPVNINSVHGDGIIELLRDQVRTGEKDYILGCAIKDLWGLWGLWANL